MHIETYDLSLQVPGGQIFARQWSPQPANRIPIILLHDSLGCVELWRDFPAELAQVTSRPVFAYDRLGFGKSEQQSGRPSSDFMRHEAEVIFPAVIEQLNLDRFALLGHSVGGGMALMIAASCGHTCEAVVTESAQAFIEPQTLDGIRSAKAEFSHPAKFSRLAMLHGSKAQWVLDAWTEVWLAPEFASWSLDEFLPRVQCPVLAIHGDRDEFGSIEFPRHIATNVSGPAELAILTDCGHVPHKEKRAEVIRLVDSFLKHPDGAHGSKRFT